MNGTNRNHVMITFLCTFVLIGALVLVIIVDNSIAFNQDIHLEWLGRYQAGGAEISAFDSATRRLFVTGSGGIVEVLDLSNPAYPVQVDTLPFDATSVAVKNGILALAVPDPADKTNPGHVYLYHSGSLSNPIKIEVGALPDMLLFTPDGRHILVANEGEPVERVDPEGSVSIIDIGRGIENAVEKRASFKRFNHQREKLVEKGVRIFQDAASVAQDLEPEYIAMSPNGNRAYVSLQENNAVAVLQIPAATFQDILPLGVKDHNHPGNGLDASDRDGAINIKNWPVSGLYMPDGIGIYEAQGRTYMVTANEGDDRGESERVNNLLLDPETFIDATNLVKNANLGRLNVSLIDGDADGDGLYEALYSYGSRSFSIWDTQANLVFDSGDQFEQITAALWPTFFNADSGSPSQFDTRSDNKGPEPEGVALANLNGKTYAFIGLERAGGGVMVYNISDPSSPIFVEYTRADEDVSPEGLLVIQAEYSPIGVPLLVVTNEVSHTVSIYEIQTNGQ